MSFKLKLERLLEIIFFILIMVFALLNLDHLAILSMFMEGFLSFTSKLLA